MDGKHTHGSTEKLCWYTKHSSDEEGRKLPGKVERMINGCDIIEERGNVEMLCKTIVVLFAFFSQFYITLGQKDEQQQACKFLAIQFIFLVI